MSTASTRSPRRPWAEPEAPVEAPVEPLFRVVRGEPSDDELAALAAVLAAAAAGAGAEESAPSPVTRTEVLRRGTRLRQRLLAVPGAWRTRGR